MRRASRPRSRWRARRLAEAETAEPRPRRGDTGPSVRRLARDALGLHRLLPGQEEAIEAVIRERDTLALLPTGGGKSAIYQVAGVERAGPTVVVSPLLALQRDQLEGLDDHELGGAAALNSTLTDTERDKVIERFAGGSLEFLLLG